MINLEHSLLHREPLYPIFKFLVKDYTATIHIFVIHAHGQHKVQKLPVGHHLTPGHLLASTQSTIYILKMKRGIIIGYIRQRHVGIDKLHSLQALALQRCIESRKITFIGHEGATLLKIGRYSIGTIKGTVRAREKNLCCKKQRC